MIDALIGGKLYSKPLQRLGNSGKPFVTCKVRVATGAEDAIFVSVIAFDDKVIHALINLDAGDSISLSGVLTPKVWQGKPALDLVAHGILTPYHVKRKRQAVSTDHDSENSER
jgi:hypothetical protein